MVIIRLTMAGKPPKKGPAGIPASPFLYLAVRDDIDKRRLLKTKTGVSMHVPTIELTEAEATGRLQAVFLGILRDIYSKWAHISGSPPPPDLP